MVERSPAAVFMLVHIASISAIQAVLGVKSTTRKDCSARLEPDNVSMLQTVLHPSILPETPQEASQQPEMTRPGKGYLAWQMAVSESMATAEARLACTGVVVLMLAGLRATLQLRPKESRPDSPMIHHPESTCEEVHLEAEEELLVEPLPAQPALPAPPVPQEPPPPQPRLKLHNPGACFLVEDALPVVGRGTSVRGSSLGLDIPSLPATWPLRAVMSRPTEEGPWTGLELAVAIAAACDLPPLLACTLARRVPHTGGTPFLASPEIMPEQASVADSVGSSDGAGDCDGSSDGAGDCDGLRLFVHNGGGHLLASVSCRGSGFEVLQHDGTLWVVELLDPDTATDEPWIVVSAEGQPIGQTTSFQGAGRTGLKIETHLAVESPESALLLTCMLAIAALGP